MGQPGVSLLWLGEVESLTCSFWVWQHIKLSSQIRSWDTLVCCWYIQQPTNNNHWTTLLVWLLPVWPLATVQAATFRLPVMVQVVERYGINTAKILFCWFPIVPATCQCISGMDLLRQFYVLPNWDKSCRSNFLPHPVTVYWHRANQSQYWPYNVRQRSHWSANCHWYDSTPKNPHTACWNWTPDLPLLRQTL